MSKIVAFPSPLSTRKTPIAVEVIVAPQVDMWVAWLRLPTGYFTALERTLDEHHAMSDARAYAKRYGIPVTWRNTPLAIGLAEPIPNRPCEISIWPDPEGGGCWRIDHTSASGDCGALVGTAFSLDEAVQIARDAAVRLGTTFEDPSHHFGGAA
ncbi:hypothetical protein FV228_01540 [Methylobacterium sp. WL18]|uniref:hypothetical protein n=1 Tax=Methylobacterium sp. WL18 TaxID=2603897 RepID=UPI0011CC1D81|nr:hypothetical protein [Methylobacterium sp. WL18]TXN76072.1 hypothetical protein FV228_01540 [Methylobacterium sp. WL18]